MSAFYTWLASLALRRRRMMAGVWLVLVVAAGIAASGIQDALKVGGFNLPGTEFNRASNLLAVGPGHLVGQGGARRLSTRTASG